MPDITIGDSLMGAVAIFFAAIPKILAFAIILIAGWFLATLVAKVIAKVLRTLRFNDLAERSGFSGFVRQMGSECDAAGWVAEIVKWFIRLIAAVVAFDALGLTAVSDVLRQLLLWLPNLIVALVVLVIGGIAARALASLVRASTAKAGFHNPDFIARVAAIAVWAFAIVVAVNQVGVAQELVNTLFMAVVGAFALAMGLAFGLGGRDTAAEMWRRMYHRAQEAAPKMGEAAQIAANEAAGYNGPERRGRPQTPPPIPGEAYGDD